MSECSKMKKSIENLEEDDDNVISNHNLVFQILIGLYQFYRMLATTVFIFFDENNSKTVLQKIIISIFALIGADYSIEISKQRRKFAHDNKIAVLLSMISVIIMDAITSFLNYDFNFDQLIKRLILANIFLVFLKIPLLLRYLETIKTGWLLRKSSQIKLTERNLKFRFYTSVNGEISYIQVIVSFLPYSLNFIIDLIFGMEKCSNLLERFSFSNLPKVAMDLAKFFSNEPKALSNIFNVVIGSFSFVDLAWCLTARARAIKQEKTIKKKLSIPRSIVLGLAHLFFTATRIFAIALVYLAAPLQTILLLVFHLIGSYVYLWLTTTSSYVSKALHCAVFATFNFFTMIIPSSYLKPTRENHLMYYGICLLRGLLELIVFSIIWYLYETCESHIVFATISMIFVSFSLGVMFFISYYTFFKEKTVVTDIELNFLA